MRNLLLCATLLASNFSLSPLSLALDVGGAAGGAKGAVGGAVGGAAGAVGGAAGLSAVRAVRRGCRRCRGRCGRGCRRCGRRCGRGCRRCRGRCGRSCRRCRGRCGRSCRRCRGRCGRWRCSGGWRRRKGSRRSSRERGSRSHRYSHRRDRRHDSSGGSSRGNRRTEHPQYDIAQGRRHGCLRYDPSTQLCAGPAAQIHRAGLFAAGEALSSQAREDTRTPGQARPRFAACCAYQLPTGLGGAETLHL